MPFESGQTEPVGMCAGLCYSGDMNILLRLSAFFCILSAAVAAPLRHPVYEPPSAAQPVSAADAQPRLIPVSPRVRYARDVLSGLPPEAAASEVRLRGWRGERLSAQILVESPGGIRELTAEPCVLLGSDGSRLAAEVNVVRYVTGAGALYADVLDVTDRRRFDGVVRPLWLTLDLPAESPPRFEGTLCVRVNGCRLALRIAVDVDRLCLPPPEAWRCHLDLWQHPDAVARWHDVPMWSDAHLALLKPAMVRLAAMGQKTITATLIDEAWNAQTYDRYRTMIRVTRRADGSWSYDYTAFDRWVSFMREEVGLRHAAIHCYTMIPWSLTFAYYDEAQGRTVAPRMEPGTPAYADFWTHYLRAFVAHLRERGWLGITRIAMDERPDALLRPALELLRAAAPELSVVAACNAPSGLNREFADVSYDYANCEALLPLAAARRAAGRTTTFYVCCAPPRPNTFLPSDLAESEWLLPMAAHYGLDGFLRWAYHSWPEDPFACQDYGSWPSGDTSLVYPGNRSSLRLEALRNGIETFEKIAILRRRAADLGRPEALTSLERALSSFTVARGRLPGVHRADLEALDEALWAAADALR